MRGWHGQRCGVHHTWARILEAGDDVLVARVFVRGNVQAPGAEMRATPHPRTVDRAIKTAALQGGAGIEIWNETGTVRALGLDQAVGDEISCFVHGSCTTPLQPGFSQLLFQPLAPFLLLARDFRFGHGLEVGGVRGGREMRSTQTHVKHGAQFGSFADGARDDAAIGQERGLARARHLSSDHVAEAFVAVKVAGSLSTARATVAGKESVYETNTAKQLRRCGGGNVLWRCGGGNVLWRGGGGNVLRSRRDRLRSSQRTNRDRLRRSQRTNGACGWGWRDAPFPLISSLL